MTRYVNVVRCKYFPINYYMLSAEGQRPWRTAPLESNPGYMTLLTTVGLLSHSPYLDLKKDWPALSDVSDSVLHLLQLSFYCEKFKKFIMTKNQHLLPEENLHLLKLCLLSCFFSDVKTLVQNFVSEEELQS